LQFALLPGTEPKANTGAPKGSLRSGKSEAKKAKDKKVSGKATSRQRKKKSR
jgi:ribonuclease R